MKKKLNPFGWVPLALVVWFAVFGIYEIIERTLLEGANPDLIYILHIIRGTGTSFLLAGLAAWHILRQGRPAPVRQPGNGLRSIVAETQAKEFLIQSAWIIRLRWIAIAGVLLMALASHYAFDVISGLSALAIIFTAFIMTGYNALFAVSLRKAYDAVRMAFAQVFLDLASLTIMLYFSGGVHNPFFLFYIFHIVIAGILLRRKETYLVTLMACVLFCGMVSLQEWGVIPSHDLMFAPDHTGTRMGSGWLFECGILTAFVTTAWCTAYFTTTIMEKLRRRSTEIIEASEILSQERAKTEDIVRSVGAGMLILDREKRVVWANDITRDWFGSDIVGKTCHQGLWRGREGCRSCRLPAVFDQGIQSTYERSSLYNGKQKFFLTSKSPIRAADGKVDQVLMLIQDITSLKEMELHLLQAGKMAAAGQLATGIAHEINNPLAIVASSAEILQSLRAQDKVSAAGKDMVARHLKKIGDNVYRCKNIIQNLLDFSRRTADALEEVDMNALLKDTLQLVDGSARTKERRILLRVHGRCILSRSRPQQIQQVLLNLIFNALDATAAGASVTISCHPQAGGVEVSVSDTGQGIAEEHLGRIFEPFFTTRPVGKGTGLGLYLSHRIVKNLHGRITVESRLREGATFRVWLPSDSSRRVAGAMVKVPGGF